VGYCALHAPQRLALRYDKDLAARARVLLQLGVRRPAEGDA